MSNKVIVFNTDEVSMNRDTALGIIYELNISSFERTLKKIKQQKDNWIMVDYDCKDNLLLTSRNPKVGTLSESYLKEYIIKNYRRRLWAKNH